nr:methyl-accepting chemotaxis protein [Allorhizobium sonneratiae]
MPILYKVMLVIGFFGLFTILVTGYASLQIKKTDTSYSALLDQESTAALYLARANRTMQSMRATIGDLMMSRTDQENNAILAELKKSKERFISYMDIAIKAMPEVKDIANLKVSVLKIVDDTCANSVDLGAKSSSEADIASSQLVFLKECKPAFATVAPEFTRVTDNAVNSANKQSDDLSGGTNRTITIALGMTAVGFILTIVLVVFAIRSWLIAPITRLVNSMGNLANGDLSTDVGGRERGDEIGTMARAVQIFKDNGLKAREVEKQANDARSQTEAERERSAASDRQRASEMAQATSGLAEGLKRLSSGDLTFELREPFASDFEGLRTDFNRAVEQLRSALAAVAGATSAIDSGSRELSHSANDLSKRTEQQAASLEETAAALNEITTNVANSTKRAEEARSMASEANRSARQSGEVVANAVDAMQRIEQSSSQISNIIGVIDEIAFQTNLLALNAGVEAARAGEAGKGFAVVAQEVRELAQRSAKAAKEIKDLIRNSADEVENGVQLVTATGEALKVIENHVVSINAQLDAIAVSAREQSVGLNEVNTAINQMDQVTQQNAAMVEEATAATAGLAREADNLRDMVGKFQLAGHKQGVVNAVVTTDGVSNRAVLAHERSKHVDSSVSRRFGRA